MRTDERFGLRSHRRIEVTWGDCDAASVVFYPRYYEWFDACTHVLLAGAGLSHHTIREKYGLLGTPLIQASAKFVSPATFGDVIDAESYISKIVDRGFTVSHRFCIGNRVVVEGEEVRVWAKATGDSSKPMRTVDPGPEIRAIIEGRYAF
ncbi:MAG: acyl-CoA thioesterase [Polyangiaceae bacterium]|nr:acyl-CoA thioesterase [Polyangiaceae bacterium]